MSACLATIRLENPDHQSFGKCACFWQLDELIITPPLTTSTARNEDVRVYGAGPKSDGEAQEGGQDDWQGEAVVSQTRAEVVMGMSIGGRPDGWESEPVLSHGGGMIPPAESLLAQASRDMEEEELRQAEDLVSRLELEELEQHKSEAEDEEDQGEGAAIAGDEEGADEAEGGVVAEEVETEVEQEAVEEEQDEGLVVRKGKKKGGGKKKR